MKDAQGHGSDSRGGKSQPEMRRAIDGVMRPYIQLRTPAWDARVKAAQAYLDAHENAAKTSSPVTHSTKSAPVDTHEAHEYNRDLALRVRDRQVGSGMKHR